MRFHHQSGAQEHCSLYRVGAGVERRGEGMLASPLVELAFNPQFVLEPLYPPSLTTAGKRNKLSVGGRDDEKIQATLSN